jgi:hypothetical protein
LFISSGSEANDTHVKFAWYYKNARGLPAKIGAPVTAPKSDGMTGCAQVRMENLGYADSPTEALR